MPSDDYQWITLNDFSTGIVSRKGVIGTTADVPAQLGAATVDNTYRCIALPGGGLGPLPKRVRDLNITDAAAGHTYGVVAFGIYGPIFASTAAPFLDGGPGYPQITSQTPFEGHVIFEDINVGAATKHSIWRRYRYYSDNGFDTLQDLTYATPPITVNSPAFIVTSRANPFAPEFEGTPVVVASAGPVVDVNDRTAVDPTANGYTFMFPDPATPNATGLSGALFSTAFGPLVAHQGRIVCLVRNSYGHGAGAYIALDEDITYTRSNDVVQDTSSIIFGQEFPVGYGAWGSMTASDLLLIKHYGGAYLIQGDLNAPLVRRLPNVVSTGGIECVGANSNLGFIYGVNNGGVYAWGGGDSSQSISTQLEDGFWINATTYRYGGQFLGWGDWVLAPNSYLYDTTSHSWWRIDDPSVSTYYLWQRDPMLNVVYGAMPTFSNASPRYASGYDRAVPASSLSWQSQPFFTSHGRKSTIRTLLLAAQGTGTVTITTTSLDDGTFKISAFNIASAAPSYQRLDIDVTGSKFQVRIVCDGGVNPAPIVHEVAWGYRDSLHIGAS